MPNQNEEMLQLRNIHMEKCRNEIIKQINALKENQKKIKERLSRAEDMIESIMRQQQLDESVDETAQIIQKQPRNGAIGAFNNLIENSEENPEKVWRIATYV
ncbi:unnamed protein product [Caenorhabditis angaria]|uniref:Uncharacterized protein n=1 Tax=Caenorhabditis angaria TaxID=860376 RepID=A0A9P1INN6_9PELO|nr:unnamed protein product [Caenorhabditis angaria]